MSSLLLLTNALQPSTEVLPALGLLLHHVRVAPAEGPALVDTPGAFPGADAEARGQAEAIARATERCLSLTVPLIAVITGEGGSGGAVALATANRVLMFEHAVYSVISPEGASSILWRDTARVAAAADALKLTASDLLGLGVVDRVIYEPPGGAHRDHRTAIRRLAVALGEELDAMAALDGTAVRHDRFARFLQIGASGTG